MTASAVTILLVDTAEHCDALRKAFDLAGTTGKLRCLQDGPELLDYMHRRGQYGAPGAAPSPALILLGLQGTGAKRLTRDDCELIREIKTVLRSVPLLLIGTLESEEDVERIYDMGASSYIDRPACFDELAETVASLSRYWFKIVRLPENPGLYD